MAKKNKKSTTFRNVFIGVAIVLVLAVVGIAMGWFGGQEITQVETTKVGRHTISETVNASGKLQPETEVKISADISGEIIELRVKEGDKVQKGDLLARIKPDEYQRGVEKAQAMLNNGQANLSQAKAQAAQSAASLHRAKLAFERNKKLFEDKAISQAEFENFSTEFEVARAQHDAAQQNVKAAEYNLANAQAGLREAQDALRKTSLYSPMTGTISKLNVELGERVVGTMQMAGTEMMRVANLSVMEAEVEVNENDIVRLHLGDTTDIEVDAFRGEKFKGIVTSVANSSGTTSDAISSEKVTNFPVKIRLLEFSYAKLMKDLPAGQSTPFRPGMTANTEIHTKTVLNALAVPILAVTVREEGDKKGKDTTAKEENLQEVVFLRDKDGKAVKRPVKIGIQDDTYIEIKDGLKDGEEVISGPYRVVSKDLSEGDKVELKRAGKEKKSS